MKTNDFDEPKNSLKSKSTVPKDLVMDCERIRNYLEVRHFTFSKYTANKFAVLDREMCLPKI